MSGRWWIGLLLIAIGLGFFLHQANVWDFFDILSSWWPLIIIIIGVIQLMNRSISSVSGLLFITVGSLLLINQWVHIDLTAYLWSIILILIGFTFLFSHRNRHKTVHSEHTIHSFVLFSGADIRSQSQQFIRRWKCYSHLWRCRD